MNVCETNCLSPGEKTSPTHESQEHVYERKKIWELKQKNNMEVPKYEEILWGKASEMIEVEKILRENMKILEEYEQKPS